MAFTIYSDAERIALDAMETEIRVLHDQLEAVRGSCTEEETKLKFALIDRLHKFNQLLDNQASKQNQNSKPIETKSDYGKNRKKSKEGAPGN